MVDKCRQLVQLLAISAKMDLAWLLRDSKVAAATMVAELLSNLSAISGVFLIALRFGGIGGMSADEVLFMLAYSTMTTGIFILFGSANNLHISRIIGRGQLEHLMQQPLPLWMSLGTMGFVPFTGSTNLITGIILLVIACKRLQLAVTFGWLLLLFAFAFTTMVLIVSRAYLVSTAAFYAPVQAEEITYTAIDGTWTLSTFPLSGLPKALQIPLIINPLLPEGLMAWFPSLCLLGKPPLGFPLYYPMLFALMLALLASFFFQKGLRHYVYKGSNRYVPYGFRR